VVVVIAMTSIKVRNEGSTPTVKSGYDAPHLQRSYYVYRGVSEDVARLWSSLDTKAKNEVQKRAMAEKKDMREVLESMINPMPDRPFSDVA
jgi:hypothetical protein